MSRIYFFLILSLLFVDGVVAQHQNIVIGTLREPNEPSIAINPRNTNSMMAGANLDNYYYSEDEGYTWTENRLFSSTLGVWGDPCLVADTLGNFYFFHLSNPAGAAWIDRIVCQKSSDNGATWNNGTGIGLNGSKAQDKEWVVLDDATNTLYMTWTQFDTYGSSEPLDSSIIRFSKSTDLGATWSNPVRLNKIAGDCIDGDNTVEGAVPAVGPEGQLYVAWAGPLGISFDKSYDGGETWLNEDIHVSEMPGGWDFDIPGISRANGLPITCCDLSDGENRGTIYINWSDQRNGSDDTDVWLVRSTDEGITWTEPVRVNDDPPGKQQFFCWMTIDQTNGKLWFVFYDRRNYHDFNTDVFMALTEDGGHSFSNFRVSESPFIPVSSVFFGDYTNVAAHNNVVRPIWTHLHENQLSIRTAIVDPVILTIGEPLVHPGGFITSFPNPFAVSTVISYKLYNETLVHLEVFNMDGRKIATLVNNELKQPGKYMVELNACSVNLDAGVYYYILTTGNFRKIHKIVYAP